MLGYVVGTRGPRHRRCRVVADGRHARSGRDGLGLHPDASGHGYATEAVRALIGVAFGTYGMRRVVAQIDARNTASARLCHRVGMKQEAHLREDHWAKGEWTDNVIYGLLASEWPTRHPADASN